MWPWLLGRLPRRPWLVAALTLGLWESRLLLFVLYQGARDLASLETTRMLCDTLQVAAAQAGSGVVRAMQWAAGGPPPGGAGHPPPLLLALAVGILLWGCWRRRDPPRCRQAPRRRLRSTGTQTVELGLILDTPLREGISRARLTQRCQKCHGPIALGDAIENFDVRGHSGWCHRGCNYEDVGKSRMEVD